MRYLKILFLISTSLFLFTGCGNNQSPIQDHTTQSQETSSSQDTSDPDVSSEKIDDTNPPREGMLRSRLTNEWVDADVANTRPLAIMIPNESEALPHYNLSEASVLYEANVEGRMTRLLGIFEDWEKLDKIGNIRSLRTYYAYWSFEWDAFLVHFGGPFFIDDLVGQETTQNIDGNLGSTSAAFFRTTDKSAPHNAYASGSGIAKAIKQLNYPMSYRGLTDDHHFNFVNKVNQNTLSQYANEAVTANKIDLTSCYPLTRCYFEYNPEDNLYYRYQHLSVDVEGPHLDGATGEQLSFTHIIIKFTNNAEFGAGYLAFQCHDTTRDGWYFTNGKGIHVNWKKTSDYGATRYYDDAGNEIEMNTGKTMICIVEDGDTFSYQ